MNRKHLEQKLRRRPNQLFSGLHPAPYPQPNSVQPAIDGEEVFEEIYHLINKAKQWCYLTLWGFDEDVVFSKLGQNIPSIPTAEKLLKQKAVSLLSGGITPDIKVLVWDYFTDNSYDDGLNDVGDLSIVKPQWKDIKNLTDRDFINYMRQCGSAAEGKLLLYFFNEYKKVKELQNNGNLEVYFPSGILVVLEKHKVQGLFISFWRVISNKIRKLLCSSASEEKAMMGSHHQKFVLTEQGCYIGGLNFHKDYWDSRKHFLVDNRRASSVLKVSPKWGTNVPPLHDTGTIVRGPVIEEAMAVFVLRWDNAIKQKGCHDYLVTLLNSRADEAQDQPDKKVYKKLAKYLKKLRSPILKQYGTGYQYNTSAQPGYEVDYVDIAVSLPKNFSKGGGQGVTDILKHYEYNISTLKLPNSFLYMENQYFSDYRIAKKIKEQWYNNKGHNGYFAFISITYDPGTFSIDERLGGIFFKDKLIKREMQNLKWLEITTARSIFIKDTNGQWIHKWNVLDPRRYISFEDDAVNNNPEMLDVDKTKFLIKNAVKIDSNGNVMHRIGSNGVKELDTVPCVTLQVNEVMTVSDIMAYTLVSNMKTDNVPNNPQNSNTPNNRYRNFLLNSNIYIHSKCSIFLNCQSDTEIQHWATIGSANISPTSLGLNGEQDSEMNVWWKHSERDSDKKNMIKELLLNLWSDHLGVKNMQKIDINLWKEKGWKNLFNITNGQPIDGSVVRLDVVERYRHLT